MRTPRGQALGRGQGLILAPQSPSPSWSWGRTGLWAVLQNGLQSDTPYPGNPTPWVPRHPLT